MSGNEMMHWILEQYKGRWRQASGHGGKVDWGCQLSWEENKLLKGKFCMNCFCCQNKIFRSRRQSSGKWNALRSI
jgi:hypothetical protein